MPTTFKLSPNLKESVLPLLNMKKSSISAPKFQELKVDKITFKNHYTEFVCNISGTSVIARGYRKDSFCL